ncbi:hypothetical protein ABEB36_008704 [Hypothenemus hampei]|uniref:Uncharacterized protein n=1 Tax=Hypothenemus hampei TaxID=57062 RepID=A0ABD1EMS5_HYPHA
MNRQVEKMNEYSNLHNLYSWKLEKPHLMREDRSQHKFKINYWTNKVYGTPITYVKNLHERDESTAGEIGERSYSHLPKRAFVRKYRAYIRLEVRLQNGHNPLVFLILIALDPVGLNLHILYRNRIYIKWVPQMAVKNTGLLQEGNLIVQDKSHPQQQLLLTSASHSPSKMEQNSSQSSFTNAGKNYFQDGIALTLVPGGQSKVLICQNYSVIPFPSKKDSDDSLDDPKYKEKSKYSNNIEDGRHEVIDNELFEVKLINCLEGTPLLGCKTGTEINAKELLNFQCGSLLKFPEFVLLDVRPTDFGRFCLLKSYDRQTNIIAANVIEFQANRTYGRNSERENFREFIALTIQEFVDKCT